MTRLSQPEIGGKIVGVLDWILFVCVASKQRTAPPLLDAFACLQRLNTKFTVRLNRICATFSHCNPSDAAEVAAVVQGAAVAGAQRIGDSSRSR